MSIVYKITYPNGKIYPIQQPDAGGMTMAFGEHAADPTRPYLVYAFRWRGKPFYVGIAPKHSTRHMGRWTFVPISSGMSHLEHRSLTKAGSCAPLQRGPCVSGPGGPRTA